MTDLQYLALVYISEYPSDKAFSYNAFAVDLRPEAPMHRRTDKNSRDGNFAPSWAGRYIGRLKAKGWVRISYTLQYKRKPYVTENGRKAMKDYELYRNETEIP